MASKIDICNLALAHLGQAPLSSVTQEDERARRIRLFYEPIRDELLRTHNWGFAATEAPLALIKTHPLTQEFLYKYPADALFIRRVFTAGQPHVCFEERFDVQEQTRLIVTKAASAFSIYTRRITDETQFDEAFAGCFALALAAELAVTLTGDYPLANMLSQKLLMRLDEARRTNMMENTSFLPQKDAFSEVR
jgi:hypothetical protein